MPVRCNFCGAELKPQSRFCLECGQLVDPAAAAAAPYQQASAPAPLPPMPSQASPMVSAPMSFDERPGQAPGMPFPGAAGAPDAGAAPSPLPDAALTVSAQQVEAQYAAPSAPVSYSVMLTFGDGSAVIIDDDSVLGRKPQATADEEGKIAVPLVDPLKSSSRVHLRLYLTPQGVNVVDAGSGNGTVVEHAGTRYETRAHEPFWIEPGDRLWLGEVPVDVSLA